jgi:mannose/fructose/N-acetylgalactosamine-specific phosphotransferase system component IID
MERSWQPKAAGILCIVAGVLCAIPSIVIGLILAPIGAALVVAAIAAIVGGIYALRRRVWGLALAGSIFALITPVILVTFAIWLLAIGLSEGISPVPTIPEILARIWYLAIALGLPGILAIIFVSMGRREFR